MFSGSERVRAGDHRRFIESTGGFADAFVIEDAAAFNDTVPAQHLDLALELEADRMRGLIIRAAAVDDAKAKVKDAIRRSQSSAFFRALVAFLGVAYTKHPYGRTAGGTEENVDAVTLTDVQKFYSSFYGPQNALLVIVGDVEEKAVRAAVDRHFAKVAKGEKAAHVAADSEPPQKAARREETAWPAGIGFVVAGYHIPAATHADIYALQLASLLLSRGETGRLRKRFDADKLVRGASAEALVREHPGLFVAYAAFNAGADTKVIEGAVVSELDKLETAPSAKELQQVKNHLACTHAMSLESVTSFARQVGQSWVLTGNPSQFLADLAAFDKITPQALQAATKKYFTEANRTIVVITPGGGQ
jgi:zinc protease